MTDRDRLKRKCVIQGIIAGTGKLSKESYNMICELQKLHDGFLPIQWEYHLTYLERRAFPADGEN